MYSDPAARAVPLSLPKDLRDAAYADFDPLSFSREHTRHDAVQRDELGMNRFASAFLRRAGTRVREHSDTIPKPLVPLHRTSGSGCYAYIDSVMNNPG
jgi:hypothetical protein